MIAGLIDSDLLHVEKETFSLADGKLHVITKRSGKGERVLLSFIGHIA